MKRAYFKVLGIAVLLGGTSAWAQEGAVDKSGYHLLRPAPREHMRDLSPDRPDTTESPRTVDAGHFQAELSFFEFTRGADGDAEEWAVLPTNLKVGLLNNVDLQLVLDPYVHVDPDEGEDAEGFGQTTLRVKVNFWGNDSGRTAMGVMPFVTFPTADDELGGPNRVEGGIILPYSIDLSDRVGLGLMGEIDFLRDDEEDEYDTEFLHTAVLGFSLTERWGAYLEYIGIESFEGGVDYQASVSGGVTYAVSDDLMLDAGVVVGLTDDADDYRVFAGMTFRL